MTPKKRDRGAPAPGAGSFEVIDLGEPQYHTPVGPARSVVRPMPADAVAVTNAGDPLLADKRKSSPLVPASEEVAKLPRLAGFAFAARCARRVWPLARAALVRFPKDGDTVAEALNLIETFTSGQGEAKTVGKAGRKAMQAVANVSVNGVGSAAVDAMCAAHHAADAVRNEPGGACLLSLAVDYAVKAITRAATVETPIRKQLLCIRRDFDRLAHLAKKHNWTDDTPVPPETFGPMWPKNLTPDWAKEPEPPPPAAAE